jgi:hypothetical protein
MLARPFPVHVKIRKKQKTAGAVCPLLALRIARPFPVHIKVRKEQKTAGAGRMLARPFPVINMCENKKKLKNEEKNSV